MAWSESGVVCRKHPIKNPQPGVCPSCLRERLSKIASDSRLLPNNNNSYYYVSSNSPSISGSPAYNYGYSSSSRGCSSPTPRGCLRLHRGHQRIASDKADSIYLAISSGNISSGLKKSRSMAFASRITGGGDGGVYRKKKKGGFWNKLLLQF
ncbi:hypothetical protein OROGR_019074 [Orobanche gracilis]